MAEESAETAEALHEAIQAHINAVHGARVVVNWTLCCDTRADDGSSEMVVAVNEGMNPWTLLGMASYGQMLLLGAS